VRTIADVSRRIIFGDDPGLCAPCAFQITIESMCWIRSKKRKAAGLAIFAWQRRETSLFMCAFCFSTASCADGASMAGIFIGCIILFAFICFMAGCRVLVAYDRHWHETSWTSYLVLVPQVRV
jgi:hypothetical protein